MELKTLNTLKRHYMYNVCDGSKSYSPSCGTKSQEGIIVLPLHENTNIEMLIGKLTRLQGSDRQLMFWSQKLLVFTKMRELDIRLKHVV